MIILPQSTAVEEDFTYGSGMDSNVDNFQIAEIRLI